MSIWANYIIHISNNLMPANSIDTRKILFIATAYLIGCISQPGFSEFIIGSIKAAAEQSRTIFAGKLTPTQKKEY
jgi:hypothetical protein